MSTGRVSIGRGWTRLMLLATSALSVSMLGGRPGWGQGIAPNAAPMGGQVSAGSASIAQSPGLTQVTQSSSRAAIDWQQFNVGRDQRVNFQQPSASSWTLNRVVGPDPSVIAGQVTANGGVAIVNQSGMVFARGAQVNVASLIASAPNTTNENFMAGRMVFDGPARPGARVVNAGTVTVADRGLAAMVGPEVRNSGVIRAKLGRVALAGAEAFTLDLAGDGLISIDVTRSVQTVRSGATALVTNSGTIQADGGSVLLTAHAASGLLETLVTNTGRVAAGTVPAAEAGSERRGSIALQAEGGGVRAAGVLSARGGAAGVGGQVALNADGAVTVAAGARLDASGGAGGGQVLVGTPGLGVQTGLAARTTIERGATLRADARRHGNGGTVAVNGRDSTVFQGAASARGGRRDGDGGTVEISGHGAMTLDGTVDVKAPAGRAGTLLLDPQDITIIPGSSSGTTDPVYAGGGTVVSGSAPTNGNLNIAAGSIEGFSGLVQLSATRNVTVTGAVNKANGGLRLTAQTGLLDVQQSLSATTETTLTGATVRIAANVAATGTVNVTSTVGAVSIEAAANVQGGTRVNLTSAAGLTNAGTVSGGFGTSASGNAVEVLAQGDVVNTGNIYGRGGGAAISGGGTVSSIFVQTQGTITNSGQIFSYAREDGTGGVLRLDTAGLNSNINNNQAINGGAIVNQAAGIMISERQISLTSNTSVRNDGTIAGGISGNAGENGVSISAGTSITNTGSISALGGGRLFNNNQNAIDAITLTAGTSIVNTGSLTSTPDGDNYGAISVSAGTTFTNSGSVSAARNALITASGSIDTSGTLEARVGRVTLTASGTGLPAGQAWSIRQTGGVLRTLNEPPPSTGSPTNRGAVILQANQGDIQLLGPATITAATNVTLGATSGAVTLDGGTARYRLTAASGVQITSEGSIRLAQADIAADTVLARAGMVGTSSIGLGGVTFTLARGMLLSAAGGVVNPDGTGSTVRPLVAGTAPVVVFDTRIGNALTSIPAGLPTDVSSLANASPATQASLLGPPTAGAAGPVSGLQLDAGNSPVFLLINGGRVAGTLVAGQVGVYGFGGSADLSGRLNGDATGAAASFAQVSRPTSSVDPTPYRFNGCVFGGGACGSQSDGIGVMSTVRISGGLGTNATRPQSVVPFNVTNTVGDTLSAVASGRSVRNLLLPQPEIVRLQPLRGRLSDPDVQVPNVVDQDY